jgi:RimJ/RimL family protein N-acetyltransferase
MTEALIEVVHWALRQPAIFRIGAVCDVENIGSARVMEKARLLREGVLRRWLVHPNIRDKSRDCFSYARVRQALQLRPVPPLYRVPRRRFRRRVDAPGRQRS